MEGELHREGAKAAGVTPPGGTAVPARRPAHSRRGGDFFQPRRSRWEAPAQVGIIWNAKARHNIARQVEYMRGPGCAMPRTHAEMHDALASFAARGVDVLVIDGGDGTVRDVLSAAVQHFGASLPRLAIVPSGKTNALANDLGIPKSWTIQSALNAARLGNIKQRSPLAISYADGAHPDMLGFMWGSGAFVRATALAQTTHRFGAFNGVAVGLSIAGGIAQTLLGARDNIWRRGDRLRIETAGGSMVERTLYLMLASTLERLPGGIRPFGKERQGLKLFAVDAPPKRMLASLPGVLLGSESAYLRSSGYHRADVDQIRLLLESEFILDGEAFSGGEIVLRKCEPLSFVVP